ncbi:hypothetical protein K443DRAFT_381944 [Laccaria amethystina LaAM-08-1]|uniref:Uncharacterized protein n=1 Tax=Laccaria amethystina LaAM-08-1 TaxID=1095629 RepID=A0A0C9WXN0_9AGAR|nr:hypothetical protein K443DRAFT_381944 [Laccaria amethystina LaAM-08-1]
MGDRQSGTLNRQQQQSVMLGAIVYTLQFAKRKVGLNKGRSTTHLRRTIYSHRDLVWYRALVYRTVRYVGKKER